MSQEEDNPPVEVRPDENINVGDILDQLDQLEETITTSEQQEEIHQMRGMLSHLPGTEYISKYTTRDMSEAFVGSIIFALPLLVEGGVFEIADHFVEFLVAGIPVFLIANIAFVIVLTTGLLYAVDFREVKVTNPILGLVPRRLVGVLSISFLTGAGLMFLWGRAWEEDPTTLGIFARITVIWAAAALGASLGDILPGESKGTDLTLDNLNEFVD